MYVCIGFNFCLSSSLEINNLNKRKSLTSAVLLLYFYSIYYVDIGAYKQTGYCPEFKTSARPLV